MKKLLAIFISISVILIIGFVITLYVVFNSSQISDNTKNSDKKEAIVIHNDEPFITNLKDSDSYLKADISIEVESQKDVEKLEKNLHRLRDRIITILRNVSEDDMKRSDIQEILKNQIKQDLQESLKIDTIIGIYFNEFVVQ